MPSIVVPLQWFDSSWDKVWRTVASCGGLWRTVDSPRLWRCTCCRLLLGQVTTDREPARARFYQLPQTTALSLRQGSFINTCPQDGRIPRDHHPTTSPAAFIFFFSGLCGALYDLSPGYCDSLVHLLGLSYEVQITWLTREAYIDRFEVIREA